MKKLILLLLFVPIVSLGQMDYYVSAKGGLNVRETPEANAKKVSTLSYGTFVSIDEKISKDNYKEIIGFSYHLIKKFNE